MKSKLSLIALALVAVCLSGCSSEPEIPKGQSIQNPLGPGGPKNPAGGSPQSGTNSSSTSVTTPSSVPQNASDANKVVREAMKKSGN